MPVKGSNKGGKVNTPKKAVKVSPKKPTGAAANAKAPVKSSKPVKAAGVAKTAAGRKSTKAKQQKGLGAYVTPKRVYIAAALLLSVSYILAVYAAFTTSIIPGKYIGLGFLISFAVTAFLVHGLFKAVAPAGRLRVFVVLALAGVLINFIFFSVATSTKSFINSLSTPESSKTVEYAIVGLKANNTSLATSGLSIAVQSHDQTNEVQEGIKANMKSPTIMPVATAANGIVELQNGTANTALYTTAYLSDLESRSNNDLFQQLQVLATFKVKLKSQKAASVDVKKPFIVYISGIDTYGAINTTSRSDVNILAVVNPQSHDILFVNTPRDYYVQLNGTTGTKDKLTHAGLYGIDMSVKTLQDLYNVDINYNVKINFTSLEKVVDALGGVDVYSGYNFSSGGHTFVLGKNTLNGKQALAFSRERYSFEDGDRTRGRNQMRVLTAIIEKLSQPSVIVNYQSVLSAMEGLFQTNMPPSAIASLVRNQLNDAAKWKTTSISVDGSGASEPTYSMGSQKLYVMVPNEMSLNSAKNQITTVLARTK